MEAADWIAGYAAVVSTAVFAWEVIKARPKFKTRLIHGIHEPDGCGVYVAVQNLSSQAVHLASVEVLYRSERPKLLYKLRFVVKHLRWPTSLGWVHTRLEYYEVKNACPTVIEPGNSHQVFVPELVVKQILGKASSRELMACAQDRLWRTSYSGRLVYDAD